MRTAEIFTSGGGKVVARIAIRRARPEDADIIASHRARIFLEAAHRPLEDGAKLMSALVPFLWSALEYGEYQGWLATTEEGRVVGGAGVQVRQMVPRLDVLAGREALVMNIYVEMPFRRQGLARRLLDAVMRWCASQGIQRVVLHATPMARGLYQSAGFVPTGEMVHRTQPTSIAECCGTAEHLIPLEALE